MEITITKSTTEKVNVELPYYSKNSCYFFKVIAEDKCIAIHEGLSHCGIEQWFHSGPAFESGELISNESEFNEAFERLSKRLRGEVYTDSVKQKVLDLISHVSPERHITATFTDTTVELDYIVRIQYDKEQDPTISKEPVVTTNQIKIIIDPERIEEQIEEALGEVEEKEIEYE